MGSTWQTTEKIKIKGPMGKKYNTPYYMQFVPGVVVHVVTSNESLYYNGDQSINTILAIPHITDKLFQRRSSVSEENRYRPLFRGMVDTPAYGDPVLLCTIGEIQYYMGPLNTDNNPNWNIDNLWRNEINVENSKLYGKTNRTERGESRNFFKSQNVRLEKSINYALDRSIDPETKTLLDEGKYNIGELHGDMVFEGRHGNSIRLGSRRSNSNIYISNGRDAINPLEGPMNGSFLSMTTYGTLTEHFGKYIVRTPGENDFFASGFILGSDQKPKLNRYMANQIKISNGNDKDPWDLIYNYKGHQTLLTSDRIIINSKGQLGGDLMLSSNNDIHIGASNNLTITTEKDVWIESQGVYIGSPMTSNTSRAMEPMVLGTQLTGLLRDLVICLSKARYINPAGVPTPLHDVSPANALATLPGEGGRKSLDDILKMLESITSNYHWIEPNIANQDTKDK